MAILRTEAKDYGGVCVFTDADDAPIYLAPHLLKTHWDGAKLTLTGLAFVDAVLVARVASAAEAAKIAAVENAINAELEKRKAAATAIYDKTPEDAVKSIWPSLLAVVKP